MSKNNTKKFTKSRKQIIKDWVARLESGNLKQTTGTLYRKSDSGKAQYCCLGVLCKTLEDNGFDFIEKSSFGDSQIEWRTEAVLPTCVTKFMELEKSDGDLAEPITFKEVDEGDGEPYEEKLTALSELNDNAQYSFKKIAEVIKKDAKYK